MAGLSHDLLITGDLQEAVKRIIKQHQRECENAGEFEKAREARAALKELQHQTELEGLCRLFCRHYKQLSAAEQAYEKHLHLLDVNWQTQQLPALLEKVRRWRQQLQERQEGAELASLSPSKAGEDSTMLGPRFRKEAFDLQKKVVFLGHQGRYDEAEELQKRLEALQRMDAATQKAVLKAKREQKVRRILAAQKAERHSLESKVERLVNYHNKQNADAINVLRRKYMGQRRNLVHIHALETQKYLHTLESFTPTEAVRMASAVIKSEWKGGRKVTHGTFPSECKADGSAATGLLRSHVGKGKGPRAHTVSKTLENPPQNRRQPVDALSSRSYSQPADGYSSKCSSESMSTDRRPQRQRKEPQPKNHTISPPSSSALIGSSTRVPHLLVPLRTAVKTNPLQRSHSTQEARNWRCHCINSHVSNNTAEYAGRGRRLKCHQEANKRRTSDHLYGSTRSSQCTRLTAKSVTRAEPSSESDTLRYEIFAAWRECAVKVTKEQAAAETWN